MRSTLPSLNVSSSRRRDPSAGSTPPAVPVVSSPVPALALLDMCCLLWLPRETLAPLTESSQDHGRALPQITFRQRGRVGLRNDSTASKQSVSTAWVPDLARD